jgi:myosin protein heavy chain
LETRRRLTNELENLKKKLDESEEARELLSKAQPAPSDSGLRGAAMMEYEDKISKLESSRRALMAQQRLTIQELDEKTTALAQSEKIKRQFTTDLEDMRVKLEAESLAKSDESANRKKLALDVRDLQLRLDSELAKSASFTDALDLFKARADNAAEKLEAAELGRVKAEKNESQLLANVNEIQSTLDETVKVKRAVEEQLKELEDQITDLQDKIEDNSHEMADLTVAKKKLREELLSLAERHRADLEERELFEEQTRRKYQKEIKSLLSELEQEKLTGISLKEGVRDLETEVESLNIKIDTELRSSALWKKEKEKLEQRIEDLSHSQSEWQSKGEEQANSVSSLNGTLRDIKIFLE